MRIKIGDTWYDSDDVTMMVVLSDIDKSNIANMHDSCDRYAIFMEGTVSNESMHSWMDEGYDKDTSSL